MSQYNTARDVAKLVGFKLYNHQPLIRIELLHLIPGLYWLFGHCLSICRLPLAGQEKAGCAPPVLGLVTSAKSILISSVGATQRVLNWSTRSPKKPSHFIVRAFLLPETSSRRRGSFGAGRWTSLRRGICWADGRLFGAAVEPWAGYVQPLCSLSYILPGARCAARPCRRLRRDTRFGSVCV